MKNKFHLALCAVLLAGFAFFRCNTDEGNLLTVNLSDSLRHYDSILIVVKTPDGHEQARRMVLQKDFGPVKDGKFQEVLDLGDNPPKTYDILITTFAGEKETKYVVAVTPGEIKKPEVVPDTTKPGNGKPKPASVVLVTASPQTLARQGAALTLVAHVLPDSADQSLIFQSTQTTVAAVDTDGVVHPGAVGEADIVIRAKADTSKQTTLHVVVIVPPKVESLSVAPDTALLYLGGAPLKLVPTVVVEGGASASVTYESGDKAVATVLNGVVMAVDTGATVITVRPLGDTILKATCKVHVVKDVPVLDVGDDRKCKKGETLTFDIKVRQGYGTIAALRWNLDGDSTWEGGTTDSSASPSHRYDSAGLITAVFYVKDSEGNEVTVTRKIQVGSLAPLVDIVKPGARDTIVNTSSITVAYKSDGVSKTKDFALKEGPNELVVSETGDGGTGTDTVEVTLDTQAPVVKITSPADSSLTNKSNAAVAWTVDGVPQTKNLLEDLSGKQGQIAIIREAVDAAGNHGSASVTVTRDTVAPPAPVFTSNTTSSPTNSKRPTWAWNGGAGGAGVFVLSFDGSADVQQTSKTFTPASDLGDGPHVLAVKETDQAGNVSPEARDTIIVKTAGPGAPAVQGTPGPTRAPRWTWTGTGRSGAKFRAVLYKNGVAAVQDSLETASLAYTPDTNLTKGSNGVTWELRVREQDALGNWGAEGFASIVVDVIAPGAPSLSAPSYATASPTWTWAAVESNARYVYRLLKSGSGVPVDTGTTTGLIYPQGSGSAFTEGAYTLYVRALDEAGNFGAETSRSVYVDITDPVVAITGPSPQGRITSVNPTLTGTASDNKSMKSITYSIQGGGSGNVTVASGSWTLQNLAVPEGTHVVTLTATDSAGNTGTAQASVTKLSNVVFVRKTTTGKGTGTSWEDAYPELWQVLTVDKNWPVGKEIWVTKGAYAKHPDSVFFECNKDLLFYGGFTDSGTATTVSTRDVAVNTTNLQSSFIISDNFQPVTINNFLFDGFVLNGLTRAMSVSVRGGAEIKNTRLIKFIGEGIAINRGTVKITNCALSQGTNLEYAAVGVYFDSANALITGTTISNNEGTDFGGGIHIYGGNATVRNCVLTGNKVFDNASQTLKASQITFIGGSLTIGNTTIEGGVAGIDQSGLITDEGGNKLP